MNPEQLSNTAKAMVYKGKGILAKLFYYIGDIFSPGNNYWSKTDRRLGNK